MHKQYLMAPGPTPVPESARLAMARELIHHRGDGFREVFAQVRRDLKWLFETESEVLAITCSGTGAFEAAMTNFTSRGDTVVSIGGGKFGERWADVGRAFEMNVVEIDVPWGEAVTPQQLSQVLDSTPDVAMVTLTASETSTGVFHPVEQLAAVVHEHSDALFAVDGITAVGVHRMPMDAWGIDILVSGSQKALGVPPGLGFVAAHERAWRAASNSDHPKYYFDLSRERTRQVEDQTAFTPAISIVLALREALAMMRDEGRQALIERHRINAQATRAGVTALGLKLLANAHANSVTAALVPDGMSAPQVVRRMLDDEGITIAGGQKALKPSLIRLGHIGFFQAADIRMMIGALEMVLKTMGLDLEMGAGTLAVQEVFASQSGS